MTPMYVEVGWHHARDRTDDPALTFFDNFVHSTTGGGVPLKVCVAVRGATIRKHPP